MAKVSRYGPSGTLPRAMHLGASPCNCLRISFGMGRQPSFADEIGPERMLEVLVPINTDHSRKWRQEPFGLFHMGDLWPAKREISNRKGELYP
jgi:hypothetical protein